VGQVALTAEQRKGAKVAILVVILVLVLFVSLLAAGRPIMHFGTEPLSIAYTLLVYVPVMAICVLAYRRLE
jgi:hypothetical protein